MITIGMLAAPWWAWLVAIGIPVFVVTLCVSAYRNPPSVPELRKVVQRAIEAKASETSK
uniref:hypothetical protein n=1 Tax=Streptosporangium sp. CA-235898 TaxID=3240073 RepID=UPI003F494096